MSDRSDLPEIDLPEIEVSESQLSANQSSDMWRRRAWIRAASLATLGFGTSAAMGGQSDPPVTALIFHPDGSTLLAGSQAGITCLDPATLQQRDSLRVQMANVHDLVFSPDADELFVAGGYPGESGVLESYHWPSLQRTRSVETHQDVLTCVCLSPDSRRVLAVSADGGCSIFDRRTWKVVTRFDQHSRAVLAGTFLPDGDTVVTAGRDQTLRVWTASDGQLVRSLHNHTGDVRALALRPQQNGIPMIASGGADATVRLWQPTIGRMVRFARLDSPPLCVDWHSGGAGLIAGCRDGKARRIDPQTVHVTATIDVSDRWLYAVAVDPRRENQAAFGSTNGRVGMAELAPPAQGLLK